MAKKPKRAFDDKFIAEWLDTLSEQLGDYFRIDLSEMEDLLQNETSEGLQSELIQADVAKRIGRDLYRHAKPLAHILQHNFEQQVSGFIAGVLDYHAAQLRALTESDEQNQTEETQAGDQEE